METEDGQAAKPKEWADLNFHPFPGAGLKMTGQVPPDPDQFCAT
jgi:hypothetical protein